MPEFTILRKIPGNIFNLSNETLLIEEIRNNTLVKIRKYIYKELLRYFKAYNISNKLTINGNIKGIFQRAITKAKIDVEYDNNSNQIIMRCKGSSSLGIYPLIILGIAVIGHIICSSIMFTASFFTGLFFYFLFELTFFLICKNNPKQFIENIFSLVENDANTIKYNIPIMEPSIESSNSTSTKLSIENEAKKCPQCAELIKLEARKCRFCGEEFKNEEVEELIVERTQKLQQDMAEQLQQAKFIQEKLAKGFKQCPNCKNWDVHKEINKDTFWGDEEDWCPHCNRFI